MLYYSFRVFKDINNLIQKIKNKTMFKGMAQVFQAIFYKVCHNYILHYLYLKITCCEITKEKGSLRNTALKTNFKAFK